MFGPSLNERFPFNDAFNFWFPESASENDRAAAKNQVVDMYRSAKSHARTLLREFQTSAYMRYRATDAEDAGSSAEDIQRHKVQAQDISKHLIKESLKDFDVFNLRDLVKYQYWDQIDEQWRLVGLLNELHKSIYTEARSNLENAVLATAPNVRKNLRLSDRIISENGDISGFILDELDQPDINSDSSHKSSELVYGLNWNAWKSVFKRYAPDFTDDGMVMLFNELRKIPHGTQFRTDLLDKPSREALKEDEEIWQSSVEKFMSFYRLCDDPSKKLHGVSPSEWHALKSVVAKFSRNQASVV